MSNVFELHNKEQRELEASAWIAKLDRELTNTEADDIRCWIAADPRNKEMLSNMAGLWDDMDSLSRLLKPGRRAMKSFLFTFIWILPS